MSDFLDRKNIMVFLLVAGVALVFWYFVFGQTKPVIMPNSEEGMQGEMVQEQEMKPVSIEMAPMIDARTGVLTDGPGYERSDTGNMYVDPSSGSVPSNYYFLDDGSNGQELSPMNNMCSKSCCSNSDWPSTIKQRYDPYVCNNKDQFVPSNMFCQNSYQDSGCLCLTKRQAHHLYNRGGNGREWF